RGERRGHRQGDALRPRIALRRHRRRRIHRLWRQRHPVLREPLPRRANKRRTLRAARNRAKIDARGPYRPEERPRLLRLPQPRRARLPQGRAGAHARRAAPCGTAPAPAIENRSFFFGGEEDMRLKLFACALGARFAAAAAHAEITVGVSLGSTGRGASLGVHYKSAYQLMPKALGGEPVRYIILDDASDPT